jgi:acyl dehydratase
MPIDPFHLDPDRHKPRVPEKQPLFHPLHAVALAIVTIAALAAAWVWGDLPPA